MTAKPKTCPCGAVNYDSCCGRYHNGASVPDAEMLMRSRYSAYVLKLDTYLLATWHPDTRPATLELDVESCKWLGLEVKTIIQESADCCKVEFVARYKVGGRAHRLHETSQFLRISGQWFYMSGEFKSQLASVV